MPSKFIASATNGIITRVSKQARKTHEITDKIVKAGERQKSSTFRDHELFKEFNEFDEFIPTYSLDDLPLASSLHPKQQQYTYEITRDTIDTDISFAKILGTTKKIFFESVLGNPGYHNYNISKYVDEGFKFQDVANIYHKAKSVGNINNAYVEDALDLISQRYPLETVLSYMDEAVLKGGTNYEKGLLDFVAKNPGKKHLVVCKNCYKFEKFDKVGAKHFHILENLCKSEKEIDEILKACRCFDTNGTVDSSIELLDLAIDILKKEKKWTNNCTEILQSLKQNYKKDKSKEYPDITRINRVRALINSGIGTTEEIIKAIRDSAI